MKTLQFRNYLQFWRLTIIYLRWMMLSRNSKFLFRRWLTSMLTSVLFWKIAAMLVQSSTTFRGGGWGVSSLILCTHRDSVSRISLLWVFLFRPWLTIFLFWNIALTFKLREVPPRYSGLQSLSGTTRKKVDWTNTSIGSQTYMKPAARSNSSRLSLSAILCWWISRRW